MLKKSKLFVIAIAFVAVFAVASVASAADLGSTTLRKGSSGPYVVTLQTLLGVSADGAFGPMTEAAVKAWQASHGLVADGIVGPATKAAMNAGGTTPVASGCQAGWTVNPMTGAPCSAQLPAGCQPGYMYSVTTGARCVAGPTPTPGLSGDAGDSEMTPYSTGEKNSIKEGEEDVKVLGFKVEAIDSDVEVLNVKVEISNTNYDDSTDPSSENIGKYLDSVDIYKGTEKIGSEDLSDFTRSSDTPDIYSKTIALSGAVVEDGDKDAFFVMFNADNDIDSENMEAELKVEVVSYRFKDASGVVFTYDPDSTVSNDVTLEDASADDDMTLKSSSNNPDDMSVAVEEDDTSDDYLALAFKLDVDDDSSDVTVTELPILLTFASAGASVTSAAQVIDKVEVSFAGETYTADETELVLVAGAGEATYTVDLLDEDVVLGGGDIEEAKVYITFAEQEGNYSENAVVTASIAAADIEAETEEDDTFTVDGTTITGGDLTLTLSKTVISGVTVSVASLSEDTVGSFTFKFTVEADGSDADVDAASIAETVLGPSTPTASFSLIEVSGTSIENAANDFTVEDGNTATFSLSYTIDPDTAGTYYIRLDTVDGITVDKTSGALTLAAAA